MTSHGSDDALAGCRVLVTRPADQAGPLARALREAGATPLLYPTIEVTEPPDWGPFDRGFAATRAGDWLVFTSPSAVRLAFARLQRTGCRQAVAGLKIAAVGPGTASALAAEGLTADLVPQTGSRNQEGLASALGALLPGTRVLFPRALEGRDELARQLTARQVSVETVPVSQTRPCTLAPLPPFDAAIFASPSALRPLLDRWGADALRLGALVAIGPVTAQALREAGLAPAAVAANPNRRRCGGRGAEGLASAPLSRKLRRRRLGGAARGGRLGGVQRATARPVVEAAHLCDQVG